MIEYKNANEVLKTAIDFYGKDMQMIVAIEELSELLREICKYKRHGNNIMEITEEMADVYIMIEQLIIIFGINRDDVEFYFNNKIERLKHRIENENF